MKKTNNPFKMQGSWIGLVFALILIVYEYLFNLIVQISSSHGTVTQGSLPLWNMILQLITRYPLTLIFGFLLGWGIQVLWRKIIK